MPVWCKATARDVVTVLGNGLADAHSGKLTVEFVHILPHQPACCVIPGTLADTITCIHRIFTLCAEIRMPGTATGTNLFCQCLTVFVCPCKAAQITTFAETVTGHKKAEWVFLLLCLYWNNYDGQ